uniref:Uncharacterized protein n=1 Tax=Acrobeloides nanus TaxID=290746 RepID=A0A914CTV8_9BILA
MNLTLEDLQNLTIAKITNIVEYTILIVHLIFVPIIIFVILMNSKKIKIYRWYLINTVFWNAAAGVAAIFLGYSILNPGIIILFNSIFENAVNDLNIWYIVAEIYLFCYLNTGIGVALAVYYRLLILLNFLRVSAYMEKKKIMVPLYSSVLAIFILLIYYVMDVRRGYVLSEENYLEMYKRFPLLEEELRGRKFLCKI